MKLFIPEIGSELQLTKDWSFSLFHESRNESAFEVLGIRFRKQAWRLDKLPHADAVIPKGEVLKVDRIYIRKGMSDFSSVSFLWKDKRTEKRVETVNTTHWDIHGKGTPHSYQQKIPARPVRFWAKLSDVNMMDIYAL